MVARLFGYPDQYVYRDLWEKANGPLPQGVLLHHKCENVWCINLEHLEPLTRAEHAAIHLADRNRKRERTHCPSGHPYDEENTRWVNSSRDGLYRVCRACSIDANVGPERGRVSHELLRKDGGGRCRRPPQEHGELRKGERSRSSPSQASREGPLGQGDKGIAHDRAPEGRCPFVCSLQVSRDTDKKETP